MRSKDTISNVYICSNKEENQKGINQLILFSMPTHTYSYGKSLKLTRTLSSLRDASDQIGNFLGLFGFRPVVFYINLSCSSEHVL